MNWKLDPQDVFGASPIIPVMVIHHLDHAIPMAKALSAGGIDVFEITLRTDCALEAIGVIKQALPEAIVGAGTVITPTQYEQSIEAGAQFVLSPGQSVDLLKYGQSAEIPLIPGVSTPSEIMTTLSYGYRRMKFFPAEVLGGIKALSAISAPLPEIRFCPTGGINAGNVKDYLSLDCVETVGGTWMLAQTAIQAHDWSHITQLTRQALALLKD
jgi:2-dehydro-3-deoxyphosphogluconate aldolase/(4S)-4-hydroxy-2-oxoglutarate aldolase